MPAGVDYVEHTAFRSAGLTLADWFSIDQGRIGERLLLTLPLLAAGAALTRLNFSYEARI